MTCPRIRKMKVQNSPNWQVETARGNAYLRQKNHNRNGLHLFRSDYFRRRRFQWPRSLRRRSAAVRLPRVWVPIPPGVWISVCCGCRVLSGRGLCDELITRPEESYRLCCVVVCYLETSQIRRRGPLGGAVAPKNKQTSDDAHGLEHTFPHL